MKRKNRLRNWKEKIFVQKWLRSGNDEERVCRTHSRNSQSLKLRSNLFRNGVKVCLTRHKFFLLAKQMKNDQKDVVGAKFITCDGKLLTCDQDVLPQWQNYFSNLFNEPNPFEMVNVPPLAGPLEEFTIQEVALVMREMKNKKSLGQGRLRT